MVSDGTLEKAIERAWNKMDWVTQVQAVMSPPGGVPIFTAEPVRVEEPKPVPVIPNPVPVVNVKTLPYPKGTEMTRTFEPTGHHRYNCGSYTSLQGGYQDPAVALAHAQCASDIIDLYAKQFNRVVLLGMDGSSMFLSAILKMLRPEFYWSSSSKGEWDYMTRAAINPTIDRGWDRIEGTLYVLVDDCISGARCLLSTRQAMSDDEPLLCIVIGGKPSTTALKSPINTRVWNTRGMTEVFCTANGW